MTRWASCHWSKCHRSASWQTSNRQCNLPEKKGGKACGNVSCTAVAGRRAAKPNMQTCQSELRPWSEGLSLLVPLVTWSKHNWFEAGEPDCFEKHSTTHPEWNINSAFHAVILLPHSAEAAIRTMTEMKQRIKKTTHFLMEVILMNISTSSETLSAFWDASFLIYVRFLRRRIRVAARIVRRQTGQSLRGNAASDKPCWLISAVALPLPSKHWRWIFCF